jgi:hypothetical protein
MVFILRPLLLIMLLTQDISNNKRVLCIYANSADNPVYVEQLRLLAADRAGLTERDIVIEKYILNDHTAADFRQRTIKGSFTVILIGKDGGEKYRASKALTLQKLYAIVDAMPMRREEMRRKKDG